ncbi:MAG: sugar ABC transporter ATP-binding protein [Synergistaceae bacterium]|jgi:simple sugar transport system ATP-binding protein|nr:sugar ABC transporter ATP-binding protein [Synergistaceae bacterium]
MSNLVLQAKALSKKFVGVQALDKVSLDIEAGTIHCLAGENGSGKSTFVKTISGIYQPDEGEIVLNGNVYAALTPAHAMREGVQVIYQDLSLFPYMSLAENIALNRLRLDGVKIVDWKEVWRVAKEQTEKIGVDVDLNATAIETSMAGRQIAAICRALSQDARLLFMDEPTAALTRQEVDRLLKVVCELKNNGLSVVFISHKLDEIFRISDNITIFRDGKKVGDFESARLDEKSLAYHMTGRDVRYPRYRREAEAAAAPLLAVKGLSKQGHYHDVSFEIRRGDILGLIGLLGSGRTELAMSLFGLNPPDTGVVAFEGKTARISSPVEAKRLGIALLPEDRGSQGLFRERGIRENITSTLLDRLAVGLRAIDAHREREIAEEGVKKLRIRAPGVETPVGTLSGGNAQKVVVAKWSAANPKLFIMDSPTVGIDIGSKAEIYEMVQSFAKGHMAVLFITDELEELMCNCNRVLVMANHRIIAALDEGDMEQPGAERRIADLIGGSARKEEERGVRI